MKKILFPLLFIGFLTPSCKSQKLTPLALNADNNSLLWRVSGNGIKDPSYLFGTFHLLCKDDIHFSDALKTAMQRSDTIYMEMDMDDPSVLLGGLLYMNMKGGKKLQDFYTPEEYQRVKSYFEDTLNTPLMLLQSMKPYFLVSLLYPKMMDCSAPSGVEQELMALAKEYKKSINGLETIQFQASVFDSIPYEWQAKELLKNIDSLKKGKEEFETILKLYKEQSLDSISSLTQEGEMGDDKYGALLLTDRNKNWAKKLNDIMPKESVFVAVGAGHLGGNEGLIDLLRKKGYTVEPLKNK